MKSDNKVPVRSKKVSNRKVFGSQIFNFARIEMPSLNPAKVENRSFTKRSCLRNHIQIIGISNNNKNAPGLTKYKFDTCFILFTWFYHVYFCSQGIAMC